MNGRFRLALHGAQLTLRSDDGRLTKRCSLQDGKLTVSYSADPSLGTIYVRSGLTPAALDVFMGATLNDRIRPDGALEVSANASSGNTVRVALRPLSGARLNGGATFGGRGARGVPLVHQAELFGRGTFALRIEPEIR